MLNNTHLLNSCTWKHYCSERDPYTNHSTAQPLAIILSPKSTTAIRYLIYKHTTFLRHKVIRALPNATVL